MDFLEYYNNNRGKYPSTDKNSSHSYISEHYNNLFTPLRDQPIKFMEIGLFRFDSIRLFRDWFTQAKIMGIEKYPDLINSVFQYNNEDHLSFQKKRFDNTLITGVDIYIRDAYIEETVNLFEDDYFDIIIDDGSHEPDHQLFLINHWLNKIKPGGRLIIEDIRTIEFCRDLSNELECKTYYKKNIYDLTQNNLKDNILFEVIK